MLLVIDLSASTRFGSGVMTVHDLIAEVSSLFALAAARRDRVGAVLFDERVRRVIPPRLGWRHGLRVVREVLGAVPSGRGTAVGEALRAAGRMLRRRGVVVLVTDRACAMPRRELLALGGRHEVVVVRVSDPLLERGFVDGAMPVLDTEAGRRAVLHGAPRHRPEEVPAGIDVVDLSTDRDYLQSVKTLFRERERRARPPRTDCRDQHRDAEAAPAADHSPTFLDTLATGLPSKRVGGKPLNCRHSS